MVCIDSQMVVFYLASGWRANFMGKDTNLSNKMMEASK